MKASCVTLNYFLFILLISTGIVNAQTVTGTVFKDPQGDWSIQSNGEHLEIREPENGNKIWAKFHDDSYFQLIGTPNFIADGYIQAGGNITLDGTHMIFRNSSGNGVIDYGNGSSGKLYFRRLSSAGNTSSYADRMILSNEGFLSIGAIHASTPLHIYNSNNTLVTYQTSDGGPFYHEWKTSNTNILARQGFINDLNHYEIDLNGTGGKLFKITTDYGDVRLGARNGGWAHFYTSMPKYYFDKEIWVNSGKIGSYDENLSLQVRGTTRMTLTEEGNVGIGAANPLAKLHVLVGSGTGSYPSVNETGDVLQRFSADNNGLEIGVSRKYNDGKSWILARHGNPISFGKYYHTLHLQPDVGDKSSYKGVAIGYAANTSIGWGTHLAVNGSVGIGTTDPGEYKLAVNGTIKAKEVKVSMNDWPDDVFKPGYQLPTIDETEVFIRKNGHLPGIPSEKQVLKDGVNLADMQKKLLRKVEEMTLLMIQLKKENDALKDDNIKLSKQINEVKNLMVNK
jgi:hypothetical protein